MMWCTGFTSGNRSVNFLSIKKAAQELRGFFIKYLAC
jgi:hypothetical protein